MKESIRFSRFWMPAINTILWGAGLCIGVFGLLPKYDDPNIQFIIAAYSVYLLFVADSIVEFLNISACNSEQHYNANVFMVFGWLFFIFATVVVATFLLIINDNKELHQIVILVAMVLHKGSMAFFSHNQNSFLSNIKGGVYNSNI